MKTKIRSALQWMFLLLPALAPAAVHAAGTVTLTSAFDCYAIGDTVSFTLANGRDSTIYMPHIPVWSVHDNTADTLIYPSIVFMVIDTLAATDSTVYDWNQIDYKLNAVSAGTYRVEVSYSNRMEPWSLLTVADTFDIKANCPSTGDVPTTWGEIKQLFR